MAGENFLLNGGGIYADASKGKKIAVVVGVLAFFLMLGSLVAAVCLKMIEDEGWQLRCGQGFSALLTFVIGPLLAIWLVSGNGIRKSLGLERENEIAFSLKWGLMAALGLFLFLPLVNYTAALNEGMTLPEFLKPIEDWMRSSETEAADMTDKILATKSLTALLVNILVVALIPAVGEELMFRVVLQGGMQRSGMNAVVAVVLTSVIFSSLHLQFFGFLPRFILSLYLGFLYVCGRGMWMNSFAHFTNNAMEVLAYFVVYYEYGELGQGMMEEAGSGSLLMALGSLCLGCAWCGYMYRKSRGEVGQYGVVKD